MKKDWTYKKLGEFIEEYSVRDKGQGFPVYSVTNTRGFCQEFFGKNVASDDTSNYKVVPRGCFAYNPSRINVGSVAWQNQEDNVSVSPLYVVFSVSPELRQDYLLYYIKSNYAMTFINALSRGAVRNNLRLSTLKTFDIPYASPSEQKDVVVELDLLSGMIEKQKAQIEELDKLSQSIFYDMFGDPIANDKGWKVKKFGDECTDMKYGTSRPACENGRFKYLRMGNITMDGHLDLTDLKTIDIPEDEIEKCIVRYGDILFNRTNSHELIGKTCMFDLEEEMIIAGYIIRVRLSENLLPQYIATMFNLPSFKKLLRTMAKGAVNQANINSKELASIRISVPPLSLQQEFAAKIEAIEAMKAKVRQSLIESETLFNSRMDYYFN